jgi:glyoxylase-like metal-dependent hydrolase (beta-lactamase superfamily II)
VIQTEQIGAVTKFRLARGFFRRPAYWTAAYFVDGLLVDTGCHFTARELCAALRRQTVRFIVNTHHHEDHIGANAQIAREHGATIYAHPLALPYLRDPALIRMQLYRRIFWGWPVPSEGREAPPEIATEHHRFRVIHAPGHSPDHLLIYEPGEGWAFTGDLFIGGKDRAYRPDYDIRATLDSLRHLASLDISYLFPGSGSVRPNPRREILDKIAYLEELQARIRQLHDRGWDEKRIARALFGREGTLTYLTGGHFSSVNLVRVFLRDT